MGHHVEAAVAQKNSKFDASHLLLHLCLPWAAPIFCCISVCPGACALLGVGSGRSRRTILPPRAWYLMPAQMLYRVQMTARVMKGARKLCINQEVYCVQHPRVNSVISLPGDNSLANFQQRCKYQRCRRMARKRRTK